MRFIRQDLSLKGNSSSTSGRLSSSVLAAKLGFVAPADVAKRSRSIPFFDLSSCCSSPGSLHMSTAGDPLQMKNKGLLYRLTMSVDKS
jgi:hypothetical protein